MVLFLAAPSALFAALAARGGSRRAGIVLCGVLTYLLYVSTSMALGAAFNSLFLAYVAGFSANFFALVLVMVRLGTAAFPATLPRRGPGFCMLAEGGVTEVVWLLLLLPDMLAGRVPPLLDHNTTFVTYALDLALIAPAGVAAGVLILRGRAAGYLMAVLLIGIILFLALSIAAATWFQIGAGITFSPGEIVGPISAFLLLGALGAWVLWAILRGVPD